MHRVKKVAVSIIVPAFNEARGIDLTLVHLQAAQRRFHEQYGFDTEAIVVDNASSDETAEIARRRGMTVITSF